MKRRAKVFRRASKLDASVRLDRRTLSARYAVHLVTSQYRYICIHIPVGTKGYTCVRITRGFTATVYL